MQASAGWGATEWSDRARTRVPDLPAHLVARPRLDERLDAARSRLTVVTGPVGAGKSAAVASWAARTGRPVAWLALEPGDDDRLWTLVGGAVADRFHVDPPVADDVESLASWLEDAVGDEKPIVVVDDLHHLRDRRRIAELEGFIRYLPLGVRFVLLSRPPFPMRLHRLRLWGEVDEINSNDLVLDADEVVGVAGPDLDPALAAAVRERTGGWAAIARLAAGRVVDGTPVDAAVAAAVGAVLGHEVRAVGGDAERLLVAMVALGPSSRERLDAACEVARVDVVLDDLGPQGPGLVEREDDSVVQVPAIAATALQTWVASARADLAREIRHRAAEWHMRRGEVDDALDQLMSAADSIGMRLLADHAMRLHTEGRTKQLRTWLAPLDAVDVTGDRATRIAIAAALALVGRADDATRVLAATDTKDDPDLQAGVDGVLARCHQTWGEPDVALDLLDSMLGSRSPVLSWAAVNGRFHLKRLYLLLDLGEIDAVRAGYLSLPADLPSARWLDAVMAPSIMAMAELRDGNLSVAAEIARRAEAAATRAGTGAGPPLEVEMVLGEVALARGEPTAIERLTRALDQAHTNAAVLPICRAAAALARAEQGAGALDVALGLIEDARRPRHARPLSAHGAAILDAAEARIHLIAGDPGAATRCIARLPAGDATAILEAWAALLDGDARRATALLDATTVVLPRPLDLDRRLLQARAAAADGDLDLAVSQTRRAITLGWPDRWVRPFVDHGRGIEPLLRRARDGSRSSAYIHGLVEAVDAAAEVELPELTDRLTDREIDVLRRMASDLTNQEIAGVLGISVNTLKSHAKAIYRKLGVQSRSEAIDLARRLSLAGP
jgi:LuxR family maltose regulon positive regulatory protein